MAEALSIRKDEHGLPSRHFISLTEAVTWAVTGHARTDEEWRQGAERERKDNVST